MTKTPTAAQRKAMQLIADNPRRVVAWNRTAATAHMLQINGNVERSLLHAGLARTVVLATHTNEHGDEWSTKAWELTEAGVRALAA
jgi:hypothetical protein